MADRFAAGGARACRVVGEVRISDEVDDAAVGNCVSGSFPSPWQPRVLCFGRNADGQLIAAIEVPTDVAGSL
jgi:hypothetical protein